MTRGKNALSRALNGVNKLYSKALKEYGLTAKSTGWKDEASQELRFQNLVRLFKPELERSGFTVNDFGCGYGAMFDYFDKAFPGNMSHYYGYDISDDMILAAREAIDDRRAEFINSSEVVTEVDYSFVSGTFNVKMECDNEGWLEYIKACLVSLSKHSRRGFAFNLLTIYVDWTQGDLYYGDPLYFFGYCRSNFSRYVCLLHDYPLYEWTIVVRK